jgi:hypothetical protein
MMRGRMNACCKGLLEAQTDKSHSLDETEVGYLHRTVKDFINRQDLGDRLREATEPSFDPFLRRAIGNLACVKCDPKPLRATGHLDAGPFWDRTAECMRQFGQDLQISPDLRSRLLHELDRSVGKIVARKSRNPSKHWTYVLDRSEPFPGAPPLEEIFHSSPRVSPFLHLAVKFQLIAFVSESVPTFPREHRVEILSSLLNTASLQYSTSTLPAQSTFQFEEPNTELISLLLEHGANPNASTVALHGSIWDRVVKNVKDPEALKLFINHGADLSLPSVADAKFPPEIVVLVKAKKKGVKGWVKQAHKFRRRKKNDSVLS